MNAAAAWVPVLGPLESAIMTVIWDAGQSLSVRVVCERMDYHSADGEDPAYTTVMSVMVILWRKGFLDRAKCPGAGHGRAWWYAAHISRKTTSPPSSVMRLPAHPTPRPSCAEPACRRGDVAPRTRDARASWLSTPSSPWCGAAGRG
jgi:predicted transcriptional regulator